MAKSSGPFTVVYRLDCGGETYEPGESIGTSTVNNGLQITGLSPTWQEINVLYSDGAIRSALSTAGVAWVTFCGTNPEFGYLVDKVLDSSTSAVGSIRTVPQSMVSAAVAVPEDLLARKKANAVFGF